MSLTIVCIGGGPSLTEGDCRYVASKLSSSIKCIAINDAYRLIPEATWVYATDYKWWAEVPFGMKGTTNYAYSKETCQGELITTDKTAKAIFTEITYLEGKRAEGFSLDPLVLHWGRSSGYAAINLAIHKGATRIILLGYDMRKHEDPQDGVEGTLGLTHWFGDHPDKIVSPYGMMLKAFDSAWPLLKTLKIDVFNCTPRSALKCFPVANLYEVL